MNDLPLDGNVAPALNLNVAPVDHLELDLNEPADMQEMFIDPIFHGPQPQEMVLELNDLLNQVNEEEEV